MRALMRVPEKKELTDDKIKSSSEKMCVNAFFSAVLVVVVGWADAGKRRTHTVHYYFFILLARNVHTHFFFAYVSVCVCVCERSSNLKHVHYERNDFGLRPRPPVKQCT